LPVRPTPGIGALYALPWWLLGIALGLAGHLLTLLAALGLLLTGAVSFWRHGFRPSPDNVIHLCQDHDGLTLHTAQGGGFSARLHPSSRVGSGWVWLRLDGSTRQCSLLLSDRPGFRNTDADALRRLRTRLRLTHTGQQDK